MTIGGPHVVFFFGGWRQKRFTPPNAFSCFAATKKTVNNALLNLWQGNHESLKDRWERAKKWLETSAISEQDIHIIAFSMGCHLAVKFVNELSNIHELQFGELFLLAPDPKYKRAAWDDQDDKRGERSAFDEARELWASDDMPPGQPFEQALAAVLHRFSRVRILSSLMDPVAVWPGNVAILEKSLGRRETCDWRIAEHYCNVLKPVDAQTEAWVHDQLFLNGANAWEDLRS
jgi:hypothetical protein